MGRLKINETKKGDSLKISRYTYPKGDEGLIPIRWDKNGKPIEYREARPEIASAKKKKKSKKG
tara:strand:- start:21 stop:209 length:189 start_codon:yes stop_codon:yes gene_type:complete